jgi:outer membrane cobalamin receptor
VRIRPRGPVQGSVSYTHLDTRVTDAGFDSGDAATFLQGDRLLRRPDDAITVRTDAALAGRLRLGATLLWAGSRDDIRFALFPEPSRRVTLPSYATVNLSATATVLRGRPGRPGLDVTARVENLLDEDYEQAVGYPARGRGIFVGASTIMR